MIFKKLKRTWSNGYLNYIPKFKKVFPELNSIDNQVLADRFNELGLDFYTEKKDKVDVWVRFTMPIALVVMIIMFICIPINFMFTGNWGYSLTKENRVLNWFKSVRLLK